MTGLPLTEPQRSQLLEALLRQQQNQRPQIQSVGELAALPPEAAVELK